MNWLSTTPASAFSFNSKFFKGVHFGIGDFKPYHTSPFSENIVFMTHFPVKLGTTLAHFQSHIRSDSQSYLGLVQDSSVTFGADPSINLALLPFIIGLTREAAFIGSAFYVPSGILLAQPLDYYIDVGSMPFSTQYRNYSELLIQDLRNMGYCPLDANKIYHAVERSIVSVAYKYKDCVFSTDESVRLIYEELDYNRTLSHIQL